jgi:hypothetical protein
MVVERRTLIYAWLCCLDYVQFFVLMDWIFGTLRVPDKEKFA